MSDVDEVVAEEIVAPMILKLLGSFTGEDLSVAINGKVDLAKGLREDPEYLEHLRALASMYPFSERAAPKIRSKRWIKWFVENSMKHKRPDLYAQIVYHPSGLDYITKQVRNIVKMVFQ